MAKVNLTASLRAEYETLFETCHVRDAAFGEVESTVDAILQHKTRYVTAATDSGVPWSFVGAVHSLETGLRFDRHLHNGDPLTARTTHVPAGRPPGEPPFTWEQSTADALALRRLGSDTDWSLAGTLYQLEGYNGWGYRLYHAHVLSPYLWAGSEHYRSGKYVADGTWSDTAVSRQIGAAVLLRRLSERGEIAFTDQPLAPSQSAPLICRYAASRPSSETEREKAENLQTWLNTYSGIFVKPDGWPGKATSDAFKKVSGLLLPGDPRA